MRLRTIGKKAAGIITIGNLPLKGLPTWKSCSYRLRLKEKVHTKTAGASSNISSDNVNSAVHLALLLTAQDLSLIIIPAAKSLVTRFQIFKREDR